MEGEVVEKEMQKEKKIKGLSRNRACDYINKSVRNEDRGGGEGQRKGEGGGRGGREGDGKINDDGEGRRNTRQEKWE